MQSQPDPYTVPCSRCCRWQISALHQLFNYRALRLRTVVANSTGAVGQSNK